MISYLAGKILSKSDRFVIVDINGVGYKIFAPQRLLEGLAVDEAVEFFTHLAIKDSAWELYGFLTLAELEFFELLLSISGIGPKTALNILGG
ncbi:MAG: Holliday junction branch migration protein RuvA, partial [Candidatus Portnoybacteria bacterium CG10_big_fil_rev_8_21_14_0_10_44_7]